VSHVQPPVPREASAERMSSRLSSGPLLGSGRKGSSDDKEVRPLFVSLRKCSKVFWGARSLRKQEKTQVFCLSGIRNMQTVDGGWGMRVFCVMRTVSDAPHLMQAAKLPSVVAKLSAVPNSGNGNGDTVTVSAACYWLHVLKGSIDSPRAHV